MFPVALSFRVAFLALLVVAPIGTAVAWLQARRRYPLRSLVDALILLPMVLPPSLVGFFLVLIFGKHGLDLHLVFTPAAAVIASALVALPMLVKTAQPAFEAVPPELIAVGSSLGLSPLALFFRVSVPMAWRGILAGLVLAFARAIGEFGATLMFAGNVPGRTNTMPVEIFVAFQAGDDARAFTYAAVLAITSLLVVMVAAWASPRLVRS